VLLEANRWKLLITLHNTKLLKLLLEAANHSLACPHSRYQTRLHALEALRTDMAAYSSALCNLHSLLQRLSISAPLSPTLSRSAPVQGHHQGEAGGGGGGEGHAAGEGSGTQRSAGGEGDNWRAVLRVGPRVDEEGGEREGSVCGGARGGVWEGGWKEGDGEGDRREEERWDALAGVAGAEIEVLDKRDRLTGGSAVREALSQVAALDETLSLLAVRLRCVDATAAEAALRAAVEDPGGGVGGEQQQQQDKEQEEEEEEEQEEQEEVRRMWRRACRIDGHILSLLDVRWMCLSGSCRREGSGDGRVGAEGGEEERCCNVFGAGETGWGMGTEAERGEIGRELGAEGGSMGRELGVEGGAMGQELGAEGEGGEDDLWLVPGMECARGGARLGAGVAAALVTRLRSLLAAVIAKRAQTRERRQLLQLVGEGSGLGTGVRVRLVMVSLLNCFESHFLASCFMLVSEYIVRHLGSTGSRALSRSGCAVALAAGAPGRAPQGPRGVPPEAARAAGGGREFGQPRRVGGGGEQDHGLFRWEGCAGSARELTRHHGKLAQ